VGARRLRGRRGLVNEDGAWCWNDLQTPDPAAAVPFYEQLFGWSVSEVPGTGGAYSSIAHEGRAIGGIMRATRGIAVSHWTVYFGAGDLDAALERTAAAGGRTLVEPTAVPAGRFAVATDPQGAVFCLVESDYDD
jgi:predicted enzyme related to lactoylglutathione lyase